MYDRGTKSSLNIVKQLLSHPDFVLAPEDVNSLLKRREKLAAFKEALNEHSTKEIWWQDFFETNKWIFGYGLNYIVLKHRQSQPNYGGTRLDGKGGQRGDYLMATAGHLKFTVLVEIKTPSTHLLLGNQEIRNGAWSFSKDLTDAISQIQANIHTWESQGAVQPEN